MDLIAVERKEAESFQQMVGEKELQASLEESTVCKLSEGGCQKKNRFFLGDLSQICLPTHPPQGFCEIWENER